ncbi:MAG: pseudouridine synthase [Candidatus Poribacteria bacterium]|nr:MAG: pseudouridine synthase [Candidatus Poribacteria bacterium]
MADRRGELGPADALTDPAADGEEIPVGPAEAGQRLDRFLAERLPEVSRSAVQRWIREGHVRVNDKPVRPRYLLRAGDRIWVRRPDPEPAQLHPEALPLSILYEDEAILIVDKPAGLVVHPGAGVSGGTLANALLSRYPEIAQVGGPDRPGIVHRLDRDTSGLLVVARTEEARLSLVRQFAERSAHRRYLALVLGRTPPEGTIDAPIGRSARDRRRFTVGGLRPRAAQTLFWTREIFDCRNQGGGTFALLELELKTGRTHQIRVHLSHFGHPVVGDPVYGGGKRRAEHEAPPALRPLFRSLDRQLLHAYRLTLRHPTRGERLQWESPLPHEFQEILEALRSTLEIKH